LIFEFSQIFLNKTVTYRLTAIWSSSWFLVACVVSSLPLGFEPFCMRLTCSWVRLNMLQMVRLLGSTTSDRTSPSMKADRLIRPALQDKISCRHNSNSNNNTLTRLLPPSQHTTTLDIFWELQTETIRLVY